MYRSISEEIPTDYYSLPIGPARVAQQGDDLSIITYGMGVHWALKMTEELNISADIIDLRTLLPWDKEAVRNTVEKTVKF